MTKRYFTPRGRLLRLITASHRAAYRMSGGRLGTKARGLPTPAYREVERKGPHHDPEFRVRVELPERAPAEGLGRSKRAAEQAAAAAMLTREGVKGERLGG